MRGQLKSIVVLVLGLLFMTTMPGIANAAAPYGTGPVHVGCVGNCGPYVNPTPYPYPGYTYIPTPQQYGSNTYYYYNGYYYPGYSYNPNVTPGYSYVPPQIYIQAPPYDHNGPWGTFGTYQNWANAFRAEHGRDPTLQDEIDYWWSQAFLATYGYSPYQ